MLHISNPSKQDVTFFYRLNEKEEARRGPMALPIPSGRQVQVGQSWSPPQRAYVIKQLELHGGRDAAETHADMGKFLGLIYRDSARIEGDEIEMAHQALVRTQEQRSAQEATRGALAFDRAAQAPGRGKQRVARVTEMSIKQEVAPGARPTGNEIDFSMSVDPEGRGDAPLPI
jgi:hypothetical protein